ncbi:hypothetical protein [Streptomyces sp. uw30]|uniref:Gfo/Idh/MocA family protein n=1 Tax=Streptomyces sp. uw30 TaxID=1828179 RepID=UPI0021CA35D2|nr:hypothetical protein [Streptomyces sp. uw30]
MGESVDPAGGHRILRADLAGGPLLDLGTYPVSPATWVLGPAESVQASGRAHPAGVNGQIGAVLSTGRGEQAVVHTTLFSDTPTTAVIAGTEVTLRLPGPFYHPGDVVFTPAGGRTPLTYTEPRIAHEGLHFEAAEVARCIKNGHLETPCAPWPTRSPPCGCWTRSGIGAASTSPASSAPQRARGCARDAAPPR